MNTAGFDNSIYLIDTWVVRVLLNGEINITIKSKTLVDSLPSLPELRRCSPRSHPNTLSFTIPDLLSLLRSGLEEKKARSRTISLPRLRKTAQLAAEQQLYYQKLYTMATVTHQISFMTDKQFINNSTATTKKNRKDIGTHAIKHSN